MYQYQDKKNINQHPILPKNIVPLHLN